MQLDVKLLLTQHNVKNEQNGYLQEKQVASPKAASQASSFIRIKSTQQNTTAQIGPLCLNLAEKSYQDGVS